MAKNPYRVGYARGSTDDQNLALQVTALREAGVKEDNIHVDKVSSRASRRPGLEAMWKDLREGDTLVVWKMDRLGRDVAELIRTVELLQKRGVELLVLTENIDTRTPSGRLHFNILASFAQYERDLTRERTKAGLAAARAEGRVGGRRVQFTPEKQAKARELFAAGKSDREVALALGFSKSTIVKWRPIIMAEPAEEDANGE